MASKRKDIIRVGDRVEIVVPEVVDRVGYPKAVKDYRPIRGSTIESKVLELQKMIYGVYLMENSKFENDMFDVLQYHLAKADHFGGRQRSVHLKKEPNILGKTGTVVKRRQVQTGTYYSASGGRRTWSGGYDDFEPAFLGDRKDIVLLGVSLDTGFTRLRPLVPEDFQFYIPSYNLKKIEAKNDSKRVA